MAGADSDSTDGPQESHEPRECMACRGTGQVISRLGGEPQMVTCPWCRGGGTRLQEIDAQEPWREREQGAEGAGAEGSAEPA